MIDFKKFHHIFVDEAVERIADLERALLELEKSPRDRELLNTIFRAAHTIKGSSSTIGLTDISRFTHTMEGILDLMRQDKLFPEKGTINLLLEATDLIKEMVSFVASETAFDFSRCGGVLNRMEGIKKGSEPSRAGAGGESRDEVPRECTHFMIKFIPGADLFRRGMDPSLIISELCALGEIVTIKGSTDFVPRLSELNPEDLYLRWDIQLKTDRTEADVKKVFEFVEDGSDVRILPMNPERGKLPLIGEMLVDEGAVKAEDVEEALKSQKKLGEILVEKGKVSAQDIETVIDKQNYRKSESCKNSLSSTIRVDLKKLDLLINTVGEMVIIHSMFQQILQSSGGGGSERLDSIFAQLQRIGKDIQEGVMSLRMLPVGEVFHRFTRLVRELSVSKNKDIELVISGEETELDKGVLERIADPLVHLIRNAIDHGIETADERASAGKPPQGTIHLSAYQLGDSVYIEIEDDGRGLNREKILKKAFSLGITGSEAGLSDAQIYSLIFAPGLSTAEKITDVSGRGVGMDIVKKNIEELNGKVSIRSRPGAGTTISIKLPLTLAIIDGLQVLIGEESFVIPITMVKESLRPAQRDVRTLQEKGEVVNVRGEFIPLLRLYNLLGVTPVKKDPSEAIVIVTVCEGEKYCLLVDDLVGQQQIVIKNLGAATPKVRDIAGGTILGDGKVALVLDVPGLIELGRRCGAAIN